MVQLLEIREALEGMAARLACGRITKKTLNKLRELLEAGMRERESGADTGYLTADREFHEAIALACGNRHLSHLMRSLRDRIQMLRYRSVILPGRARRSFREHLQIIEALNRRDADLAEHWMRTHIRNVQNDLRAALENFSGGDQARPTNGAHKNGASRG